MCGGEICKLGSHQTDKRVEFELNENNTYIHTQTYFALTDNLCP